MSHDRRLHTGTALALWQALVRDGETRSGRRLDELRESYLVFALARHLRDGRFADRAMALEWLQAHEVHGAARVEALQVVGDRCLLMAGLFPEQADRRRVTLDYFIDLGAGAFDAAAHLARAGQAELFARLCAGFHDLVAVLAAAAGRLQSGRSAALAGGAAPALALAVAASRRRH
jgi:hypothetical protein